VNPILRLDRDRFRMLWRMWLPTEALLDESPEPPSAPPGQWQTPEMISLPERDAEENAMSTMFEQVLRSGDRARGAKKRELSHASTIPW
jgi:hypothetical protein